MTVTLVEPDLAGLPSYVAALERGFAPNTTRPESSREELEAIARDPVKYVALQVDREARGGPITLPNGSQVARVRPEGLPFVEITTDVGNAASQRVIQANGGVLVERFSKPAAFGGAEGLRFRIAL